MVSPHFTGAPARPGLEPVSDRVAISPRHSGSGHLPSSVFQNFVIPPGKQATVTFFWKCLGKEGAQEQAPEGCSPGEKAWEREMAPKCGRWAKPPPASASRAPMCHLPAFLCQPPTQMGPSRVPLCCQERSPSRGMPAERTYQSPSELRGFPIEWNFTAQWPISKSCTLMGS